MDRDNKIAMMLLKLREGWSDIDIRRELNIPESTYFLWKLRINKGEYASLVNKRKPGPKARYTIGANDSRRIQIWRKAYRWGPTKIEGHLDVHHGVHIPHNRIYQLIKEKNLNSPITRERRTWGRTRWERQHSMSLWQGDWKDVLIGNPMLTFYDDHSRFVAASKKFDEATMENAIRLVAQAFRRYGTPEQILTDNGSQFRNNLSGQLTDFELFCEQQGVQVIHSTVKRPTTCGKIENFHGCYEAEIWVTKGDHGKFVRYWNYRRPCGAIGYKYPAEVFYSDRKALTNSG
ncbi:MAG: transposase [Candidatus Aenigmarchaeota archaeon]|nr:transposase [Candidatus Aenigmarchaeota archaeon]